jgi:hypothetical protein
MARVNIEQIVDHLSSEMRRALEAAVRTNIPQATFEPLELFREFRREVGRKCNTWEPVPDEFVETDD